MFKRILSACALCVALVFFVSCSTLDRIQRLDAEHALQRKNYLSSDAVNLWPFFFATGDYVSILWPLVDWDNRGFAVRPLINKENDDWALLFPFAGWDSGNGNGWCALGYWFPSSQTYGFFPLFHYNGNDKFFIAGPFWKGQNSGGFFPLAYHSQDGNALFPLFYANSNMFLSIPFCYVKEDEKTVTDTFSFWSKTDPIGFDGLKKGRGWSWYTALLWFGGHNDWLLIGQNNPAIEYARVYCGYSELANNLYLRDTGKLPRKGEAFQYIQKKLNENGRESKEIWYGLFPFFQYETFYDVKNGPSGNDPWLFNAFGGLLGSVTRTPDQDLTHVFGPFGYLHNVTRSRGGSAVESVFDDKTYAGLLFRSKNGERWNWTDEAAFRFYRVSREDLQYRLNLYIDRDIQDWEKEFEQTQKNNLKNWDKTDVQLDLFHDRRPFDFPFASLLPVTASESRKSHMVYRTNPIPTPKTRKDVENLLAEYNNPKNYIHVQKKDVAFEPFFSRETETRNQAEVVSSRTLFGLLSSSLHTPNGKFFHLFGPFGYLHAMENTNGTYEHEKTHDEFRMSMLAYRFTHDCMELKKEAKKYYYGVIDEELSRRSALSDKKQIENWEKNFIDNLDAESSIEVPKTADAARALLNEKNAIANYEKKHETGYGVVPFFAHREHEKLTDTGVFLDLLYRCKRSPEHDITHFLGPAVFYSSRKTNDPWYECMKRQDWFLTSLLYYRSSKEWFAFTPEARKKFSAIQPSSLVERLRMVDPEMIQNWENELNARYWFDNPQKPEKAPTSTAEVKALYRDYYDFANYQPYWEKNRGVLPFFHIGETDYASEFNVFLGLLSAGKKSPDEERFHLFGPFGYRYEKSISDKNMRLEQNYVSEKTESLLCYRGSQEQFVRTVESQKKYKDLPVWSLTNRILMGEEIKASEYHEWKNDFECNAWENDPRSIRTAPESLDATKKLYLEYYDPSNFQKQVTVEWGIYPFFHRKISDQQSDVSLLSGILSSWSKSHSANFDQFWFHILGPLFSRLDEHQTGNFQHESNDSHFTLAGLLAYYARESGFVRSAAGKKQIRSLSHYEIKNQIHSMDQEQIDHILYKNTRFDGTSAFPRPKTKSDWKKIWLDYNADGNFEENPYESFGVVPLFHFGTDKLGLQSKWILFPLLSWHTRETFASYGTAGDKTRTATKVLAGLLYSGSTTEGQNPLQTEWVADLPLFRNIHSSEKPFIEGDLDFESNSFSGSSSAFLLIASNNNGKALFWKKDAPKEASDAFFFLSNEEHFNVKEDDRNSELISSYMEKSSKWLNENGFALDKMNTKLGRAQLCKQILDKWVEVRTMSERGRFGRFLYRYGRCGDDAAFWLGGGLLAKYSRQDGVEDTSVLGFLYRSHTDADSSSKMIFPFITMNEDRSGSQFSFLWRLVNVKKAKNGEVSGHLMFIPF